jgi:hypothetical protein
MKILGKQDSSLFMVEAAFKNLSLHFTLYVSKTSPSLLRLTKPLKIPDMFEIKFDLFYSQ